MIYGYVKVSAEDQKLNLQLDTLKNAKCAKIFKENISAARERPELEKMIGLLTKGDTVVVWKLDRLGRTGRRPKGLSLEAQLKAQYAKKLYADRSLSIVDICKKVGVSRRTLYNYIHLEYLPINKK